MFGTSRLSESRIPPGDENGPGNASRPGLFWLCLFTGLFAIAAIVWLFGLTWWIALIAALVIGCPLVIAWALFEGLRK